jgi:hypothetical protein
VPFDIGISLDAKAVARITAALTSATLATINVPTRRERGLSGLDGIQFTCEAERRMVIVDCYSDGFGAVSIFDASIEAPVRGFVPGDLLQWRRNQHDQILDFEHPVSPVLDQIVRLIRAAVGRPGRLRPSASSDWQHGGLGYVFTVHEIRPAGVSPAEGLRLLNQRTDLYYKLMYALEPSVSGLVERKMTDRTAISPAGIRQIRREIDRLMRLRPEYGRSIEIQKDATAFANFGNLYVYCPVDAEVLADYLFIEKRIQHLWFMCYVLSELVDRADGDQRNAHDILRAVRHDSNAAIHRFKRISDPAISNRHQDIIKTLVGTSHLDEQMRALEAHIDGLYAAAQLDRDDRRRLSETTITVLLVLLAVIQALGVVLQVMETTGN